VSDREELLAARREALLARSAVQRSHLADVAADIEQRLGGLDRGINMVRSAARQPLFIAGAIAAVVLVGPRRLLHWLGRGALLWSTSRRLLRAVGIDRLRGPS
jgi:hypothetical protein